MGIKVVIDCKMQSFHYDILWSGGDDLVSNHDPVLRSCVDVNKHFYKAAQQVIMVVDTELLKFIKLYSL